MPIPCRRGFRLIRRQTISVDDIEPTVSLHERLLNDAMSVRDDEDVRLSGSLTFAEVVNKLIQISANPLQNLLADVDASQPQVVGDEANQVEVSDAKDTANPVLPQDLVHNSCRLLAAIVSELAARVVIERPSALESAGNSNNPPVCNPLMTPIRFKRIQINRTWNTGNGSPDAISFSVDRAGISIAGAVIFGASCASHDWVYELDLQDLTAEGAAPGDLPGGLINFLLEIE